MKWQDAVFAVGSVIFVLALVPSIRGPHKPPVKTSAMTATILYAYSIVYISYSLWFSLVTGVATALCWTILAVQKYQQQKIGRAKAEVFFDELRGRAR